MHAEIPEGMDPLMRAMVEYARKLTLSPSNMEESDLETLRSAGLSEEQVLDVVLIACLFNFMTRLADGLGVEVEPGKERAVGGWLRIRSGAEWDWLRNDPGERSSKGQGGQ